MPIHVNIGGVWKDSIMHVKVGSVWKAVAQAHVNVATAWKETLVACAAALCTTITIAHLPAVYTWWTWHGSGGDYDAWGFDAGADYYSIAADTAGAIADGVYTDGGSNSRTVSSVLWCQSQYFFFSLEGTSIPDTDNTFVSVEINGNTYTRATSTYTASQDGGTHWWWSEATRPFGASGDVDFKVNI